MLSHSGGTLGFVSEVAFLPEADLGVVILTNGGQGAGPFNFAVQFRLLELLFDQPARFDAMLDQVLEAQAAQLADFRARLGTVDPDAVAPYLGHYEHPMLGEIEVALRDGSSCLMPERSGQQLRPRLDEAGQVLDYVFTDPPLAGPTPVTFRMSDDGRPEVVAEVADPGDPITYVFTFVGPGTAATPTP